MNGIKLCVFDVDGVLVDSKSLHYPSTAFALKDYGYYYTMQEDEKFGTIPTREKLNNLAKQNKIYEQDIESIWDLKDAYACELFEQTVIINPHIKQLFQNLYNDNIKIALASNARFSFLNKVIDKLDVKEYVDLILSAQFITPKPDPEIYLQAMRHFDVSPAQTIIFEDSEIGKTAAYASGATVYEVTSYDELTSSIFLKQ
jgi:HAD superfamily hydrolase (TIGR01509 family)